MSQSVTMKKKGKQADDGSSSKLVVVVDDTKDETMATKVAATEFYLQGGIKVRLHQEEEKEEEAATITAIRATTGISILIQEVRE